MPQDYFAVLGLTPGRYDSTEITRRFVVRRQRLMGELLDSTKHAATREQLDALHVAYALLRDPQRQAEYVAAQSAAPDRVAELRRMIAGSLEDGLVRYSRRQAILARAQELGFSEFQAQLLIAQVQFSNEDASVLDVFTPHVATVRPARPWSRLAAVGAISVAMFLYMLHRVA
jgi:hypothetical protein